MINPVPTPCSVRAGPWTVSTVRKFVTRVTAGEINWTISGTVFAMVEILSGKDSFSVLGARETGIGAGVTVGLGVGVVGSAAVTKDREGWRLEIPDELEAVGDLGSSGFEIGLGGLQLVFNRAVIKNRSSRMIIVGCFDNIVARDDS